MIERESFDHLGETAAVDFLCVGSQKQQEYQAPEAPALEKMTQQQCLMSTRGYLKAHGSIGSQPGLMGNSQHWEKMQVGLCSALVKRN